MGIKYSSEVSMGTVGVAIVAGLAGLAAGIVATKAVTSSSTFTINSNRNAPNLNRAALAETY